MWQRGRAQLLLCVLRLCLCVEDLKDVVHACQRGLKRLQALYLRLQLHVALALLLSLAPQSLHLRTQVCDGALLLGQQQRVCEQLLCRGAQDRLAVHHGLEQLLEARRESLWQGTEDAVTQLLPFVPAQREGPTRGQLIHADGE